MSLSACAMIACVRTAMTQTELRLKVVRAPIIAVVMQKSTLQLLLPMAILM